MSLANQSTNTIALSNAERQLILQGLILIAPSTLTEYERDRLKRLREFFENPKNTNTKVIR